MPSLTVGLYSIGSCIGYSRSQARGAASAPSGCEGLVRPLHLELVQKVNIGLAFPLMRGADVLLDVSLQLFVRHALFHSV
jgi:hypothetical protein